MHALCARVHYCGTYTLCRITSVHNSDVLKSIIDEIGNDYDSAAIGGKIICMFYACAARARVCSLCVCICQSVYLFACLFVCLCLCLSEAICTFILTLHIEGSNTYRRTLYDGVKQSSTPMKAKKKIISKTPGKWL